MKAFKRVSIVATAAVLAVGTAFSLAGCGDDEKYEDTDGVTKVLMWIHKTEEQPEGSVYFGLAEKFNKEEHMTADGSKKIEVILESKTDANTLAENLQIAKASNDRYPDVLAVDAPKIAQYVNDEYIGDITEYVSAAEKEDYKDSVIKQATIGNKLYALSAMETPTALFYNKEVVTRDVLTKAGVSDYATVQNPWTWDELASVLKVIGKSNSQQISIPYGFGGVAGDLYFYSPLVYSAGGEVFNNDTQKMEGALDSETSAKALAELQKVEAYRYKGSSKYALATGDIGFALHGPWLLNDIETSSYRDKLRNIAAMPMPVVTKTDGTKGKVTSGCGSWCLAMSPTPRNADAATQVIKYFTSAKASMEFFSAIGTFPTHNSCYTDTGMNEELTKGVYGDVAKLMDYATPRPTTIRCGNIEQAFKDIVGKVQTSSGYDADKFWADVKQVVKTYDVYN